MVSSYYSGFYNGIFADKRLDKRMEKVSEDLLHSGTAVINAVTTNHAAKTAFYRSLMNKRIEHDTILSASYRSCVENISSEHVLCIQDTTEFNFNGIADKLGEDDPDVGPTTRKETNGLFCHPMIVCDSRGETVLGLADASIYNRRWGQKDKYQRDFKNQSIEKKESYRWLRSTLHTRERIPDKVTITVIGDRESDIYDEFAMSRPNTHMLIRSRADRNITDGNGKLYAELSEQPVAETFSLELAGNRSREKRKAKIEVRFCKVNIKAPKRYNGKLKSLPLYAIEAREVTPDLAKDQKPVLWRLLTTHTVDDLSMALQCIEWYTKRWLIEELFRVVKTKGFRIESTQLGTGAAIKKLIALTLEAALQVMRLKLALERKEESKASLIFQPKEIQFLTLLLQKVEGKTEKQQNPYPRQTTAWAAWIIARLGSWTGYKSHGPPGYITMKNGLDKFNAQYEVYCLMTHSDEDVYKD